MLELHTEFLFCCESVRINHQADHANIAGTSLACEDDKYQNSHISGKIHGRIFLVGFLLILRDALQKLRELRLQNIRRSPVAHKVQTGNQLKRPDFKPAH